MRIRMITTAAGPAGTFLAGQVADVDPKLGEAWVAGGFAVPEGAPASPAEDQEIETAAVEAPEAAVARGPRHPRRR